MLPLLNAETNSSNTLAAMGKVELDLEGAPFLEPEAPPEPEPSESKPPATTGKDGKPAEGAAKKSKKKLILLLGAVVLLLLLGALAAAYFLFLKSDKPAEPEVQVVVIPSTPPELPKAPVAMFNISWAPFWVEVQDPEGEIRFVYCKFMLITDNQRIAMQVANKNSTLRDAVYYYLRNKPYTFLADLKQLDVVKSEVLNIINYYILPEQALGGTPPPPGTPPKMEKVSEVLIEDYLIK